jgi:hypothetical protein
MTKKLTAEEKIRKIVDYCKEAKGRARDCEYSVFFIIELENTEGQTETGVCSRGSQYTGYYASVNAVNRALKEAVKEAQWKSKCFNNLFTARVWIKTYFGSRLVDEEIANDYEITFKGGVEV